jgi:hypothetical protein
MALNKPILSGWFTGQNAVTWTLYQQTLIVCGDAERKKDEHWASESFCRPTRTQRLR